MADQKIQLTVQVNTDTGQLEVLGAKFREAGDKAKGVGTAFGDLTGQAGGLLKSLLPFATAGGVIAFFTNAVKGAEEQNESFRRLQATLEDNGKSWKKNQAQVETWLGAVSNATRFSDSQAVAALDKFTRVTGSLTQAQAASVLAMNLSVRSGKDLSETVSLVTDLLNGNQRALIEVKREYGNVAGGAKTTQEALDLLTGAYAGSATKSEGLTDATAKLKNSFSQLSDSVGNMLIPVLTPIIDLTKRMVDGFQLLGIVVGGLARSNIAMLKLDFAGMKEVFNQTIADVQDFESKRTAVLDNGEQERLAITESARRKQKAEDAKDQEDLLIKKREQLSKIASLEAEIEGKLASLPHQTLQTKIAALEAETNARRKKINAEVKDETAKEKLFDKLNQYEVKQKAVLANEEYMLKATTAFNIANLAVQTLQTVNSLGEKGSEAERMRAKALLALQQSIAIGWAWVNAMKVGGPFATGLAVATSALLVAQFAQQSQNIDRAASQERVGMDSINVSAPVPGIDIGLPIGGDGGGGGGFPSGGGGGTGGGGGLSMAGGGGLQFVITFQGDIIINGVAGAAEISDNLVDIIGEKLIEKIKGMGQISFTGVS